MLFKGMLRNKKPQFQHGPKQNFSSQNRGFKILYNKIKMYRYNFLNHNLSKKNHPQKLISGNQNSNARSVFTMAIKQKSAGKGSIEMENTLDASSFIYSANHKC